MMAASRLRLHFIQHVYVEKPGSALDWAINAGCEVSHTLLYEEGAALPEVGSFDWLLIFGGYMGANDDDVYPYIAAEKNLIRQAVSSGKAVIGFCLGAQLLAAAMGGKVEESEHAEVGWHEVRFIESELRGPMSVFPPAYHVFQWHYDTFSHLPENAVLLAQGVGCKNQAFRIGSLAYGFQFHLEATPEMLMYLVGEYAGELVDGPYIQGREEILSHEGRVEGNERKMHSFLDLLSEEYALLQHSAEMQ
jgi:GMP synthase-like glutamine amidotransferase